MVSTLSQMNPFHNHKMSLSCHYTGRINAPVSLNIKMDGKLCGNQIILTKQTGVTIIPYTWLEQMLYSTLSQFWLPQLRFSLFFFILSIQMFRCYLERV
jgi:hypothetical protein